MKHKKKIAALLVSCQILATLAACDSQSSSNTSTAESTTTTNSANSTGTVAVESFDLKNMTDFYLEVAGVGQDEVVATVGELEITAKEILYLVSQELDYWDMMAMYGMGAFPWGEEVDGVSYEEQALKNAVDLAVIYHNIDRVAAEEGIEYDPEVETEMQAMVESLEDEFEDEAIRQLVYWDAAMTPEIYLDVNRRNTLYSGILEMYFGEGGSRVPDLSGIKDQMEEDGYYKVKHILIATTDTMGTPYDEETLAACLELAESLVEELSTFEGEELAETFHELMVEYGEDPGAVANPEGYDATPGMMVPEFEAGALALEIGEVSGIVESDFGYHIIYRLPLSEVTSIPEEMLYELETELQEEWVAAEAIELTDAFYKIDLALVYQNLSTFRSEIIPVIEAKSFDVAEVEETEETDVDETEETDVEETTESDDTDEEESDDSEQVESDDSEEEESDDSEEEESDDSEEEESDDSEEEESDDSEEEESDESEEDEE